MDVVHKVHERRASWFVRPKPARGTRRAADRTERDASFRPHRYHQSAASHALARLRKLTGDELLVRVGDGMVLTVRAEAMCTPLRRALEDIREHFPLRPPSTRRLRVFIGTSDYAEFVLLPGIMARLGREAPGVEVRVTGREG
jgi:DNA-binding transcriptional LysR family regulator